MKRSNTCLVSSWFLVAILPSCEPPRAVPDDAANAPVVDTLRESALQSLKEADEAWDRSTVAADSFVSFFTDDALWLWVDSSRVNGKEEIRAVANGGWARPGFVLDWEPTSVGVNNTNDVGYTAGEYQSSYDGEDGQAINTVGSYMAIWKKGEDGEWKVEIEIEFPGLGVFRQPETPWR